MSKKIIVTLLMGLTLFTSSMMVEQVVYATENVNQLEENIEETMVENSWRYKNGQRIIENGVSMYSDDAWANIDGVFYNDKGQVIEGATAKGIDVSHHNGTIDWEAVKQSDVDYAIIRCGYGADKTEYDDKEWLRNITECERLGIPYGVYIYSYAMSVEDAKSEVNHVLRLLDGHKLTYPVYYDLENEKAPYDQSSLDAKTLGDMAEVFTTQVKAAGYKVGIYANRNWFTNILTDPRFDAWERWVAQYYSVCTYAGEYKMWQCTASGSVPGISGYVDLDFEFEFDTQEKLDSWVEENGNRYYYENGKKVLGEKYINEKWYYFDEETGVMQTGWKQFSNKKVYYEADGSMAFGEKYIDAKWYQFRTGNGSMITGWHKFPNKTVYYQVDGSMAFGEKYIDAKWYQFRSGNGSMITGWYKFPNKTVYYQTDGSMAFGEKYINSKWYQFKAGNGSMIIAWYKFPNKTVYYQTDGTMAFGEKYIDGKWYCFKPGNGSMLINQWYAGKYYGSTGARK